MMGHCQLAILEDFMATIWSPAFSGTKSLGHIMSSVSNSCITCNTLNIHIAIQDTDKFMNNIDMFYQFKTV